VETVEDYLAVGDTFTGARTVTDDNGKEEKMQMG
jgi:hypothetical protein